MKEILKYKDWKQSKQCVACKDYSIHNLGGYCLDCFNGLGLGKKIFEEATKIKTDSGSIAFPDWSLLETIKFRLKVAEHNYTR